MLAIIGIDQPISAFHADSLEQFHPIHYLKLKTNHGSQIKDGGEK